MGTKVGVIPDTPGDEIVNELAEVRATLNVRRYRSDS